MAYMLVDRAQNKGGDLCRQTHHGAAEFDGRPAFVVEYNKCSSVTQMDDAGIAASR
jgi:hypothetical protein